MARVFRKPALALEEQTILLAGRHLIFENWADAHEHLEHIGYYRFSGYLRPFKIGGTGSDKEDFRPGTTFEMVHDRYILDRKLRMIVLEAVEKIEITARSTISNSVAARHGSHWYQRRALFAQPNWFNPREFDIDEWYDEFIAIVKRQIGHTNRSNREAFIKHYYENYDVPDMPPCWMVFEAVSFGSVSQCLKFLRHPEYQETCDRFGQNHQILSSWFHAISYLRNICAHHSRLWNRRFTIKPTIPNAFRREFPTGNERLYAVLVALQVLLREIWATNHWAESLRDTLDQHPGIPSAEMGIPDNWHARPIWGF